MLARAESPLALTAVALDAAELLLDPSGALFWVEERMLVVADMHLEKGSAFARRGQMLPPYDSRDTLSRLEALIRTHAPRTVIALGDSLHDRWAEERMDPALQAQIHRLQSGRTFIWIAGNHDPAPHGLGGEGAETLAIGPFLLRHAPSDGPGRGEICGHLHPVARIAQRGRSLRRRCFVTDGTRMVLPAFGAFAGGLDITAPAIAGLFPPAGFSAHLLGAGRTYHLPVRGRTENHPRRG